MARTKEDTIWNFRDAGLLLIRALEDLHGAESMLMLRTSEGSAAPADALTRTASRIKAAAKHIEAIQLVLKAEVKNKLRQQKPARKRVVRGG